MKGERQIDAHGHVLLLFGRSKATEAHHGSGAPPCCYHAGHERRVPCAIPIIRTVIDMSSQQSGSDAPLRAARPSKAVFGSDVMVEGCSESLA